MQGHMVDIYRGGPHIGGGTTMHHVALDIGGDHDAQGKTVMNRAHIDESSGDSNGSCLAWAEWGRTWIWGHHLLKGCGGGVHAPVASWSAA